MTRKLYIHVGPAKTGTSAIQLVLRAHDNTAVIYPKVGLFNDGSHHDLVFNYFEDYWHPEVVRESSDAQFARIREEAMGSSAPVMISSEALDRPSADRFADALLSKLGRHAFEAEILIVAREHFEWTSSIYNQLVKDPYTAETCEPDEFLARKSRFAPYADLVKRVGGPELKISVLNYHPAEELVGRFLGHIGFDRGQIRAVPVRNVSLSTKALIATLAINRIAPSAEERIRFGHALRTMPDYLAPAGFIFGAESARKAEEVFRVDRDFLREHFNIEFSLPSAELFSNAFKISDEDYEDIVCAVDVLGADGALIRQAIDPYRDRS
jgi:hypothetical protein